MLEPIDASMGRRSVQLVEERPDAWLGYPMTWTAAMRDTRGYLVFPKYAWSVSKLIGVVRPGPRPFEGVVIVCTSSAGIEMTADPKATLTITEGRELAELLLKAADDRLKNLGER